VIAMPAIDLREGACVQLVGGAYERERVRLPDPVAVAHRWRDCGFRALHVVDLDAATGRGGNAAAIAALLSAGGEVQVGGGVRDEATIARWLDAGAARVVIGTRAIEDPAWLAEAATRFPGRLVVALDERGGQVATHGWTRAHAEGADERAAALASLPLAAVLVTAVDREGRLAGPDLDLVERVSSRVPHPVHASGGIASLEDLRAVGSRGAAAAVLGMALYTGALDARAVAEEFGS